MRQARIKVDEHNTWYHCYNRVAGTRQDLPFGDREKEQFVRILHRVSILYAVRVVAYQVMSNHFHILVYAPTDMPEAGEMCQRYKSFHRGRRTIEPDSPACCIWQARSRDISWFMRHLQQLFTVWYNQTRPIRRRGSLWADRFKHSLLESGAAVWNCWAYIENNPVRAGIVEQAGDYRFGSHGAWMQSGRHPFGNNVKEVALPMLHACFGIRRLSELQEEMNRLLTPMEGSQQTPTTGVLQRRVRYWTQGLVIGSQLYLMQVMRRYRTAEEVSRHKSVGLQEIGQPELHAWRRLRTVEGI